MMRSRWPKAGASASAAGRPRWRMLSPTSRLASGRCFDASMAACRLATRDARRSPRARATRSQSSVVDVGDVVEQPERRGTAAPRCSPKPSMSMAPAEAKCSMRARRWTGQSRVEQRCRLALEAHQRAVPQTRAGRRELPRLGALRAGRPAPARRPRGSRRRPCARSPCRRAARPWPRTWSSLCRWPADTVTPPTNTGSSTANGVARPVRPIDTMMSCSSVVRSSGGNL